MNTIVSACDNVRRALLPNRKLPQRVFAPGWQKFLFFDDGFVRSADFVAVVNQLLELEGGTSACMVNLDAEANQVQPHFLGLDRVSRIDLLDALPQGIVNWITNMVDLGASSDRGEWCVYCEPTSETAVIAFQSSAFYERAGRVIAALDARPVGEQIARPEAWVWAQAHAGANRRYFEMLVNEYSGRDRPGDGA